MQEEKSDPMQVIKNLNVEFLNAMDKYRAWVFSPHVQAHIAKILEPQREKILLGESKCSSNFLMNLDHAQHDGLPGDFVGINLNSQILKRHIGQFDGTFIEEARLKSDELDDELCHLLGAKVCALKMFYPPGGYIQWHTNWDSPGYNAIFTFSEKGEGYWRHVEPAGATEVSPQLEKLVHIDDPPGWHCKAGYFGKKQEPDRVVWHSAYTREPRLTLSYLIYEKSLWENLVEELACSRLP